MPVREGIDLGHSYEEVGPPTWEGDIQVSTRSPNVLPNRPMF